MPQTKTRGMTHVLAILKTLEPVFLEIKDPHRQERIRAIATTIYEMAYYDKNPELTKRREQELITRAERLLQGESVRFSPFETIHEGKETKIIPDKTALTGTPSFYTSISELMPTAQQLDTAFSQILLNEGKALTRYNSKQVREQIIHHQEMLRREKEIAHNYGKKKNLSFKVRPPTEIDYGQKPILRTEQGTTQAPNPKSGFLKRLFSRRR